MKNLRQVCFDHSSVNVNTLSDLSLHYLDSLLLSLGAREAISLPQLY